MFINTAPYQFKPISIGEVGGGGSVQSFLQVTSLPSGYQRGMSPSGAAVVGAAPLPNQQVRHQQQALLYVTRER